MILKGDEAKDEQDDGTGDGVTPDSPVNVGVIVLKGREGQPVIEGVGERESE